MTKFVSNAITSTFIELFVFMINYEFESRMSFDFSDRIIDRLSVKERLLTQKTKIIIEKMKDIWVFIKKKLANAQDIQKKHANQKKILSSKYKFEDMIWLFIKNIKTKRSFKKLNHKWIESYKVIKVIKNACQLKLSQSMKIHDTFHISLLRKVATNFFIEQIQFSSFSIMMNDEKKYEMNDILNNRYHYDKLQYKIVWIDHFLNRTWYSKENFQKHFKKILNDYHRKYFIKSKSNLRLIVIIEAMLSQWITNDHEKTKQLIQNVFNRMKAKKKKNDRKRFNKDSFEKNFKSAFINTFDRH
jgi:hypothetical protein